MKRVLAAVTAALLVIAPSAVGADQQPATITVDELFSQTRHAYGVMAPGTYHRIDRSVTSDGDVTTTESYSNGTDFKTISTHDGFTSAWGSFQNSGWIQDDNGFVRPWSDDAPPDPFEAAMRRPDDPASGVKLVGLTPAGYAVELSPRPGIRQRRYYDARTYFLTKVETTDYDGHTRVTEYGDYSAVGGKFVAHSTLYHDDLSTQTRRTDTITYESVPPGLAHFDVPVSRPLFDLAGRSSVQIPAEFENGAIYVRVNVGGRGLDFQLDSGSSSITIDPGVAGELGLTSVAAQRVSIGGDFTEATTRVAEVEIGDLHAANVMMNIVPLNYQRPGRRIVGLLGCDFIANGALLVDYGRSKLTLLAAPPADPAAEGWSSVPIALDSCVPHVHATFSGKPGYFVVDTGAFSTILNSYYFSQFNAASHGEDTGQGVFVGGRHIGMKEYVMGSMVFGDSTFGPVHVMVPSTSEIDRRNRDGLIGRNFLDNFDLLFDYAHEKLYFKPFPN